MYPIYRRCFEEAIVDTRKEFYRVELEYVYEKQEEGNMELKILDIYVERIDIVGGEGNG